jgi:large subunit ribosomal protein L10
VEKSKKFKAVENLKTDFAGASTVFVVHYQGLSVFDISQLRKVLRSSSAKIVVSKNTLTKLAVSGTGFEDLHNYFKGPTALLFSNDPVSTAKSIVDFGKVNEKMKILGGMVDKKLMDLTEINLLAKLPSLDEIRSQLVSIISRPAANLADVLSASAKSIVGTMDQYLKENN